MYLYLSSCSILPPALDWGTRIIKAVLAAML